MRLRPLCLEDRERVRLPIHYADHPALREVAAQRGTVPVPLEPAFGRALLG